MKAYTRTFLNKSVGIAAIETLFEPSTNYVSAHATISDCNRNITLDFCSTDKTTFKNHLSKLGVLINELSTLETQLTELSHSREFKDYFK
tara:strand:- start:350 stop:619 length:270 start_codon:yes stop_codon:yes gene_type:complete